MSCIICKKLWVPGCARSFHKFPKDLQRRQKWMEIIGISKVTSNSSACSDHFTPESYYQTDGYTTVKRLLSTAEPAIDTNVKILSDVTNEATTVKDNIQNKSGNSIECLKTVDDDRESNKIVDNSILMKSTNEAQRNIDDKSISVNEKERLLSRVYPLTNIVNSTSTEEMCLRSNTLNVKKTLESINQVECHINRKKKKLEMDQESYPNKRFRFMDGYIVKSITREDFKTDKGWNTFMRYVTIQRNKNAVNRRKTLRNKNKIDNLLLMRFT